MTGVLAVFQKEMWHYFRSPIAYFVVAVFLVGTGYFFSYNIFFTGVATMASTFQNMGILLLVVLLSSPSTRSVRRSEPTARPCTSSRWTT